MNWEYRVVVLRSPWKLFGGTAPHVSAEEQLNELGSQGWELVSVQQHVSGGTTDAFCATACLKRPERTP